MSRKINMVVIHCSDSDVPAHDSIMVIREWHLARRFSDVGYHYFIRKDGVAEKGRDEDKIGAHVEGHNATSIAICLSGKHEFTDEQFRALEILLIDICSRHGLEKKDILAHCDLDQHGKTCPNFDLHGWLAERSWH